MGCEGGAYEVYFDKQYGSRDNEKGVIKARMWMLAM